MSEKKDVTVNVPAGVVSLSVGIPTIWLTYRFAPEWFEDAIHEAQNGKDHHARRREIIFAVCAAESAGVKHTEEFDHVRTNRHLAGIVRRVGALDFTRS